MLFFVINQVPATVNLANLHTAPAATAYAQLHRLMSNEAIVLLFRAFALGLSVAVGSWRRLSLRISARGSKAVSSANEPNS